MNFLKSIVVLIVFCFSCVTVMAQEDALIHQYKFDGNLEDAVGDSNGVYVAGDKGLFKSVVHRGYMHSSTGITQDSIIQKIQQAAIQYAQVVDPEHINAHRRLSRLKAILPDFSLEYDKTISSYNNSQFTRFSVGPQDWSLSLKWNLGDLIWSEQQRLIDSQVRLMVKLRQDILDEVTRLYFERRRLQLEFVSCPELETKEKQDKKLKIQELTALLDGLTGGYLSNFTSPSIK